VAATSKHRTHNICIAIGDPIIEMGNVEIAITSLTQTDLCACHNPAPEFPKSYAVTNVVLSE